MYRIIDGKSTGKTSRLMLLAKENNGIIVCADPKAMREKAYSYGIVGIDFIRYEDFNFIHRYNRPVYIDEIEIFLKRMNQDIEGYTVSED